MLSDFVSMVRAAMTCIMQQLYCCVFRETVQVIDFVTASFSAFFFTSCSIKNNLGGKKNQTTQPPKRISNVLKNY